MKEGRRKKWNEDKMRFFTRITWMKRKMGELIRSEVLFIDVKNENERQKMHSFGQDKP